MTKFKKNKKSDKKYGKDYMKSTCTSSDYENEDKIIGLRQKNDCTAG